MRVDMLEDRIGKMDLETMMKDRYGGALMLQRTSRQCTEYGELIMSLTEGEHSPNPYPCTLDPRP